MAIVSYPNQLPGPLVAPVVLLLSPARRGRSPPLPFARALPGDSQRRVLARFLQLVLLLPGAAPERSPSRLSTFLPTREEGQPQPMTRPTRRWRVHDQRTCIQFMHDSAYASAPSC